MLNHKVLVKDHLGQISACPAANTNQIFVEDVFQVVIKVTKSVKSTSGEIGIKTTTKKQCGKACLCTGVGVSNYRGR